MNRAVVLHGYLKTRYFFFLEKTYPYVLCISGELLGPAAHANNDGLLLDSYNSWCIRESDFMQRLERLCLLTPETRILRRNQTEFSIETPGFRTLNFETSIREEADKWINALEKTIASLTGRIPQNDNAELPFQPLQIDHLRRTGWFQMTNNTIGLFETNGFGEWFLLRFQDFNPNNEQEAEPKDYLVQTNNVEKSTCATARTVNAVPDTVPIYVKSYEPPTENETDEWMDETFSERNGIAELEITRDEFQQPLCKIIGGGKFAKVYKISFGEISRAVKVFDHIGLRTVDSKTRSMFFNEVLLLARLANERIVDLHGISSIYLNGAIVLEYAKFGCLRTLLNEETHWRDNLTPEKRFQIALQVARGMIFMHERNIAHRDLKSGNILITEHFHAKIADFGYSIDVTENGVDVTGDEVDNEVGTPQWMAPEVYDGSRDYIRSDSYSFGIVLWEILTGTLGRVSSLPWHSLDLYKVMYQVCVAKNRPVLPSNCIAEENIQNAQNVADVMHRCLLHEPGDRPLFDNELLHTLSRMEHQIH